MTIEEYLIDHAGQHDEAVYAAYLELTVGYDPEEERTEDEWGDLVDEADEAYVGRYDDDEDFAFSQAESMGLVSNEWPQSCIDWEQAARELMVDYCEDAGYYFRAC